jgi:predicted phosphate transport protein (TIGR00153 family)
LDGSPGEPVMGLREWIIPQDRVFFELLEEESNSVADGARKLEQMIEKFDRIEDRRAEIKGIEHNADVIVHTIYEKVNSTFVTPIDQDDITKLASLYDDVLDIMDSVANRIVRYEIKESTPYMKELAHLVRLSVDEIHAAFFSMRKEDRKEIDKRCIEVDRLENEADVVLNDSVAGLFKTLDVINILKLKEVYEGLELVTDKCEDVSQELRDIVRRYA